MEFSVSKADLVRELSLSQGVVEKRTTIPILSNVLVEASGDRIQLTATDLELGVRCSAPAKVKKSGAVTIPAKRLLDYVRLLPDANLDVKLGENQWVTITCGRSKTRIAGMSRETYPELPQMPDTLAKIPVKTLGAMIGKTIFAISSEESRFTMNGALLLVRDNGLVMVATDGHRLSMIRTDVDLGGASYRALLPKKAMQEIQRMAPDAKDEDQFEFSGDDNHLFFKLDDRLLMSRKLTGNFPDYERVLPKDHPYLIDMPTGELRSAIERVAQFSDERTRSVHVKVAKGELKVYSSLSETGESEETLQVEYSGPSFEVGFNSSYLLDFMKAVGGDQVSLLLKDANSAGEFRPSGSADYRYVVMPMRI